MSETKTPYVYVPKAGSLAEKVLTFMRRQPIGTRFTSQDIAKEVGFAAKSFIGVTSMAVKHHVIEAVDGRGGVTYRLANPDAEDGGGGEDLIRQSVVPCGAKPPPRTTAPNSIFDAGRKAAIAAGESPAPERLRNICPCPLVTPKRTARTRSKDSQPLSRHLPPGQSDCTAARQQASGIGFAARHQPNSNPAWHPQTVRTRSRR